MNNMNNKKVKICAAIIAIGYIIALWSEKGVWSSYSDKPLELFLPMVIIFLAVLAIRRFFSKRF